MLRRVCDAAVLIVAVQHRRREPGHRGLPLHRRGRRACPAELSGAVPGRSLCVWPACEASISAHPLFLHLYSSPDCTPSLLSCSSGVPSSSRRNGGAAAGELDASRAGRRVVEVAIRVALEVGGGGQYKNAAAECGASELPASTRLSPSPHPLSPLFPPYTSGSHGSPRSLALSPASPSFFSRALRRAHGSICDSCSISGP